MSDFPCPFCRTALNAEDRAHGSCWKCGNREFPPPAGAQEDTADFTTLIEASDQQLRKKMMEGLGSTFFGKTLKQQAASPPVEHSCVDGLRKAGEAGGCTLCRPPRSPCPICHSAGTFCSGCVPPSMQSHLAENSLERHLGSKKDCKRCPSPQAPSFYRPQSYVVGAGSTLGILAPWKWTTTLVKEEGPFGPIAYDTAEVRNLSKRRLRVTIEWEKE